jgi:hypothetical protein
LRWITRWYFSFEKEFVQPPWILREWDLEVHHELVEQVEYKGHQVCKFHCCVKGPLAMMFTFPWKGHTQHARWNWSLFLASPNYITFLFTMYFGRFLIASLRRIYTYLMLLMYFYIFSLIITFPKKIIFVQWKKVSTIDTIPNPLHPPQTIANLALTTSLTNMALRNVFVGNFDNICQKGFFWGHCY